MHNTIFQTHKVTLLIIGTVLLFLFTLPVILNAASVVPCGDEIKVKDITTAFEYSGECGFCHLQELAMNIINWTIMFSLIAAALLFVNAGVLYVTSPGNPSNIQRAHKIFTNTLIGLVLILVAYLLIDVLMKTLLPNGAVTGFGPWNTVLNCSGSNTYQIKKITATQGSVSATSPAGVTNINTATKGAIGCKDIASCETDPALATALGEANKILSQPTGTKYCYKITFTDGTNSTQCVPLLADCQNGRSVSAAQSVVQSTTACSPSGGEDATIHVTEGYPPTVTHQNPCHQDGTCVDVNLISDTTNVDKIVAVTKELEAQGTTPMYETNDMLQYTTLQSNPGMIACPPSNCSGGCNLCYITEITAPHWSVYKK